MAVSAPTLPERYRDAQLIARGGMGQVYRAFDATLRRVVALKVLDERYSADVAVRERFKREALAAARLSGHPDAITIFDVGECEGRPYIVMEYLDRGSLEQRLSHGRPPPGLALRWLEQAASAIDAAHKAGVVHRDVKPGNLLLDAQENVHVADFGIASAAGMDSLTQAGTVLGTAGYLSPEQAAGERAAAASDRYALGVVAFELLTGTRPFARESLTAEAAAHIHEPVPSACTRASALPCEVDPVFERALAKNPAERYRSCAELVGAIREALAAAEERTDTLALAQEPRRGSRLVPLLLGLLVLMLAGVGAALLLTRHDPPPKVIVHKRVVTTAGKSSTVTVTQAAPAPVTRAAAPTPASRPTSGGGRSLNDRGYARMRSGDYAGALPLLQQAVPALRGDAPYEGYANYNLGYTLLQLGRCSDALPYLERADRLEPGNAYVQRALARAQSC